jgi:hypothetical protein
LRALARLSRSARTFAICPRMIAPAFEGTFIARSNRARVLDRARSARGAPR